MKNYILLIILAIIATISCETDDFCTQNPVTPKLVIKFKNYKKTDTLKRRDSLYVWAKNKDTLLINTVNDSILLPLNALADSTTYFLKAKKDSISSLTFKYTPKEEYVSRSCGFKITFNNLTVTENTLKKSWIDSIFVKSKIINQQKNAHVTIYH